MLSCYFISYWSKIMQRNDSTLIRQQTYTETHSVLRNTYLLLSLTLLCSAAAAGYAVVSNASFGGSIVAFIFSFILLFVTSHLRNSVWGILSVFAFTACMGYSLGPLLNSF